MLWFSGSIFILLPSKSLYTVYILGGIIGNLLLFLSYNYFPVFEAVTSHAVALGASGGVLAILIAAATKAPNQQLNLLFWKHFFKMDSHCFVILDIISIPRGNSGGHFAHLGELFLDFYLLIFLNIRFVNLYSLFIYPPLNPNQKLKDPKQTNNITDRAEQKKKSR